MTKYMIHAYPKRMWYVEKYLIPSMLKQGIEKVNINIYNDVKGEGNLRSCLNAFLSVPDDDSGTWHIQDDVLICKDFKTRTESLNKGIVCGFSSFYDKQNDMTGEVARDKMWYSFPCIRIPNQYALQSAKWIEEDIIGNPVYKEFWEKGVNDDWAFRLWLKTFHTDEIATNVSPNLVEHIDYLIGGGSGGQRKRQARSRYWTDIDLVKDLEEQLKLDGVL